MKEYIVQAIAQETIDSFDAHNAPELIRCKYCKHSTEWYGDKRRCFLWAENGIDVFEDGYCSYGRPKEGR